MTTDARLATLDGMRGLAALTVVFYHLFARWAEPHHDETLYPHGNAVEHLPVLAYFGSFGVLSFFLISGFVIMMTLERSLGVLDFTGRRICRLWPSMLFCATLSTIVINSSDIAGYYSMARWEVTGLEYFSSIFFVPPNLVASQVGGGPAHWVEGVYWTLWAEVRFYALIALTFLLSPRALFIWVWAGVQALSTAMQIGLSLGYEFPVLLMLLFQPGYLGWFSLGICGYLFRSGRTSLPVIVTGLLGAVGVAEGAVLTFEGGALALPDDAARATALYVAICVPFVLFLVRSKLISALRSPPLVALGLASYPLYLFHERPALAGLKYASEAGWPDWLGVVAVLVTLIASALLIHRLVEDPAKRVLTRLWCPFARSLEGRYAWLRFPGSDAARFVAR